MAFEKSYFIKSKYDFNKEFSLDAPAPLFRKKFNLIDTTDAVLKVCGLGYGYYYINGEKVSDDLFTAPVSDFNKTLWYNEYDVSHLLKKGENTFAVICGNGFFNESVQTNWNFHTVDWRDNPKFILELTIKGDIVLTSDESWKTTENSPVYFNELRLGEFYNSSVSEGWFMEKFDDSSWGNAVKDDRVMKGVFRKCECEPIRADKILKPVKIYKLEKDVCVYDFGQNISGYPLLKIEGNIGDTIVLRHSEVVDKDNRPAYYGMDEYYRQRGFQVDKFICSGKYTEWSPLFTYHGFRYIEISGVDYCDQLDISAVFVHQDVKRRTTFNCSDDYITRLYNCGINSTWSNMFYQLTDCPTREKAGWTNDAQSSCEQVLTNFEAERFFEKWLQDIKDAMKDNGELPGIVPTSGWGYHWGNGPVSDGILFEIPYRIYLHTGKKEPLIECFEYFERYLNYLETRKNNEGLIEFGLNDWAAPGGNSLVDATFINAVLVFNFINITALSAKLSSDDKEEYYHEMAEKQKEFIKKLYIDKDGKCTIHTQCSVSMLIYYGVYDELEPLKSQLLQLMIENDYHLNCGMVGMRRLPYALDKCGLSDCFLKLLKAEGYPGYKVWMDEDATTLWEKWDINTKSDSKNHHMYSDFMSWLIKTPGGISINEDKCGELEFVLNPVFLKELDFSEVSYNTLSGNIYTKWKRDCDKIHLILRKDENVKITYNGEKIQDTEKEWYIDM